MTYWLIEAQTWDALIWLRLTGSESNPTGHGCGHSRIKDEGGSCHHRMLAKSTFDMGMALSIAMVTAIDGSITSFPITMIS